MLLALTLFVAASTPDAGRPTGKSQLFTTKSGVRWRVTQTAGAVPEPNYEQSYQRLDQLGANGEVVSTFNFEERAWVRAAGPDRLWAEFSLDERGELQVLHHH